MTAAAPAAVASVDLEAQPSTSTSNFGSPSAKLSRATSALQLLAASATSAPAQLTFKNVTYSVKTKSGTKEILHGIDGSVLSGEVLAIMGPSGAGKTCLIDLLTLESKGGDSVGEVRLNGEVMSKKIFTTFCATVPQQDKHWAFLTCRETVAFAADLYLSLSAEEKAERVDAILTTMGLSGCANTKVGNQFFPGLSGGQKRRLSLAIALLSNPLVLFLDEPTSGLDAAAAASIMRFLKELAVAANICIVCTIHQPSSAVYHGFDRVMLLSQGEVAFLGNAADALPHFTAAGFPMPPDTNPAEFMMDLVNNEFTDPQSVREVLEVWAVKAWNVDVDASRRTEARGLPATGPARTSLMSQTATLLRRHGVLTFRDPTLYIGRMVMFISACCFFAIIYIKARDRVQEQILSRMWLCLWHLGVPSSLGVVAVYAYNEEAGAIKREVKNGMLSPIAYIVANACIQVPLIVIMSMCALSVSAYGIGNFCLPNYPSVLFVYAINLWVYERQAQLLSVTFSNPLIGMLMFLNIWFASFLFNGILVAEDDVVWPFRVLHYLLPLKWCLRSILYFEFSQVEFAGAVVDTADPRGFTCGTENIRECFGATGTQVLDSISRNYKSISSTDTSAVDVGVMLAIGFSFMAMYVVLLVVKSTAAQVVRLPNTEGK